MVNTILFMALLVEIAPRTFAGERTDADRLKLVSGVRYCEQASERERDGPTSASYPGKMMTVEEER
jgi:hypothetical protein